MSLSVPESPARTDAPAPDAARRRWHRVSAAALVLALVGPTAVVAAQDGPRRQARSTRTDAPPRIDGRLDDACWQGVASIGAFVQVEPVEGGPPSEATEVRILHDADHLYLGIRCFDSDPAGILGTQPQRDANLDPDDRVEILFDTFNDKRNAYWFQMNPSGSRGDALITNNGADFNKPWNGVWRGRSTIDELGWTIEMAIPFKTLAFDPDNDTWGMNFARYVRRKNELNRWEGASRNYGLFVIGSAGELTGLTDIRQGIGLDVVPYLRGSWFSEELAVGNRQARSVEPGVDAYYRITPNLTAALTWNTDFADTDVDERQVNLTRFPLFFPERRDFFLQDAGQFEFADIGRDLIPFFSRRIGLVGGQEVPIEYGTKITGRAGDWNIGALDVQTGDRTDLGGENLFVTRLSKNVGEDATIGGIITDGDPAGGGRNTVIGVDANLRSSTFLGDKRLNGSVWAIRSDSEGLSDRDGAFGFRFEGPNDRWRWTLDAKEIQENFDPALGFVPRRGVRRYAGNLAYQPRPDDNSVIRRYVHRVEASLTTGIDDSTQSGEFEIQPLRIDFQSGDSVQFEADTVREVLDEPFDITDTVTIPVGDYSFERALVQVSASNHREISGRVLFQAGEFYDGDRQDLTAELDWRPGPGFTGGLSWRESRIQLPGGDFETNIARVRANWYFGPDVAFTNFLQWDNVSDVSAVSTRLRWIVEPGQKVVLAFDRSWQRDGAGSTAPISTQATIKGTFTARF